MPLHFRIVPLPALLMLALVVDPARAAFVVTVTPTITSQGGGVSLYSYVVANVATSLNNISEFDVSLTIFPTTGINTPIGAPLAAITMPAGFINLYTPGDPLIQFFSTSSSSDIKPGGSGVFSFTSNAPTRLQPFQMVDPLGVTVSGSVLAPASVPEPASLVLLGIGSVFVAGLYARGRRRALAA